MALNLKDEVLVRIYAITALIVVPVMGVLMYRTVDIAFINQAKYQKMGAEKFQERTVEADRGNIYSHNDNLLATSVPYFSLHFDPFVAPPTVYYDNIDSLAYLLSKHVDSEMTPGLWRQELLDMRDSISKPAKHYYKIAESVSYRKLQQIQSFPIFNLGQYRGGLIVQKRDERKRPFGWLARRTIGKPTGKKPGLEGAYDKELAGESGKAVMFNSRGVWIPTENLTVVEPTAGADIYSTLDVNIQDIAENALHRAVRRHLPDWGAAIVMDVETGAIRAMANLGYADKDRKKYFEQYNYAISQATEPGSTFKLATMMALLEDKKVTLDSEVDIENGEKEFADGEVKVTDSNPLSRRWNVISVRQAFEQSSNVAMAKLADSLYQDGEFSARLQSFHLNEKTGLELEGEAQPMVNDTSSSTWSGISNAWLSFGYESRLTPLQMLTFFNSVASGGRMMKPYLVEEIRRDGETVKRFKPTVLDKQIASQRTI
ncbi:MAG: penicillin-binding transpeptidase domain-containing protein, partial [Bacteroidota bacterium]